MERSQPVLPMMPGMPQRRTHDYMRQAPPRVTTQNETSLQAPRRNSATSTVTSRCSPSTHRGPPPKEDPSALPPVPRTPRPGRPTRAPVRPSVRRVGAAIPLSRRSICATRLSARCAQVARAALRRSSHAPPGRICGRSSVYGSSNRTSGRNLGAGATAQRR